MIGQSVSHYRIEKMLGAGGMGEVYLAQDIQLDRSVALKILPEHLVSDHERMKRFIREAKAASAVSHSNVAHIYEIGQEGGVHFIAMEYIEGETLAARLRQEIINCDEVIQIAFQIAGALQAAHSKGIIHRDIKPANIMITPTGDIKLLDFGVAKVGIPTGTDVARSATTVTKTEFGAVLGTLPYMSPEQIRGPDIDQRSDLFSLGAVLYQLTTRQFPFHGNNAFEIAEAILHQQCSSAHEVNPGISVPFSSVISKLLQKNRDERYQNASDLLLDLQKLKEPHVAVAPMSQRARRLSIGIGVFLIMLVSVIGILQYQKAKKIRIAREQLLPKILQLTDQAKYPESFALALEAERSIASDPILKKQWPLISRIISIQSNPTGADVFIKEYKKYDGEWNYVGQTPLKDYKVFKGFFRLKITKPGFQTVYRVAPDRWFPDKIDLFVTLDREGQLPAGMVRIPKGGLELTPSIEVEEFWMDRYELTNKEFRKFVDAGGYRNPKYWKYPFIKDGKVINWEEAVKEFVDTTGKPSPAGWELADYPKGEDDKPVVGVSWYEAAAYAEFVGKHLPTVTHWKYASGIPINFEIVPLSNFGGRGLHSSGNEKSMSPFGTFDMAGNVKEWVWNEMEPGKRYILGGSYNDQEYFFHENDQRPAFQREKTFGFRCAKFILKPDLTSEIFKPIPNQSRNFDQEKPVSDEVFKVIKSFYDYQKGKLDSKIELVNEEDQNWRKEKISFNAAYNNERMLAYLFLPRNARPPYQTVVFFPGAWARFKYSSYSSEKIEEDIDFRYLDFVIKSGRIVVYPIYKGTYNRGGPWMKDLAPDEFKEWTLHCIKDLRRTLDYLEMREDVDKTKLAYYGYSWGGRIGTIVGAVEDRFQTMILAHAGFNSVAKQVEIEELNFAPRVKIPVLMINGRYDHIYPVESSQKPFFRFLGTPEKDKVYLLFDGGHTSPRNELIKSVLGWLDRYLGPVHS
jgi:serine/threonine protein kinase/predicted esterase